MLDWFTHMIDWEILPAFLVYASVLTVTPGANNLLTFYHTLQGGVKAAILFRLGTGISYPIMSVLMVYGLSPIMTAYPWIIEILTYFWYGDYVLYCLSNLVACTRPVRGK